MLLTVLLTLIVVFCFLPLFFIMLQLLFDYFNLQINIAKIIDTSAFMLLALVVVLVLCSLFAPYQLLK